MGLWMETKGIMVGQNNNGSLKEGSHSILDICKRKTQRREIWQLLERKKLKHIDDMMHSDGTIREEIWMNESPMMESNIISQITEATRQQAQSKWPIYKPIAPERWVMNGNRIGQIQKKHKKKLVVLEWKAANRKHKAHKLKKWKIKNVREAKVKLNELSTEMVGINPVGQ